MTIDGNGYLAECTSLHEPTPFMDGDTFYLPVDITYSQENELYSYKEYRFNLPINYTVPDEISEELSYSLDEFSGKSQVLEKENLSMVNAGIMQVKAYCTATSNPPMADSGVFASGADEWKPNTEYKLNDLFSYQGNMGYVKQPTLTSQDLYPPFSEGTEALYGARPKPDADGVYPYVYNMGIFEGMLVRDDDGFIYRSITGTIDRPTELLYHPKEVPALMEKVEPEVPDVPPEEGGEDEEYPDWVQPIGAHDAYAQGAKVNHNGKKWTSDIPNNTYEPGVYGWTEVA